ncbi:MAG: isochorismatase family cysteine hydrolase [Candidatus Thermoplasmatota archaeon]
MVETTTMQMIPAKNFQPTCLKHSALLVIDMQHFFCNPQSHAYFPDAQKIIPNIQKLILWYKKHNLPVIYTRYALLHSESPGTMGRWWHDVLYDDHPFAQIIDELKPEKHDIVLRKTQYSAFFHTPLDHQLQQQKSTAVVITGVLTHLCCDTTARDAFMHGYDVFFVTDATASDDQQFHTASILTLSDACATMITTQEVLKCTNITR